MVYPNQRPAWLSTVHRREGDLAGQGPHLLESSSEAFKLALGAAWRGGATFERGTDDLESVLRVTAELVAAELIHPLPKTPPITGQ